MKMKVGIRIFSGFIILIILLVVVGAVSFISFDRIEKESEQALQVNYPGLKYGENVLIAQLNQALELRGFLLTGHDSYLNNYDKYKKDRNDALAEFGKLLSTSKEKELFTATQVFTEKYDVLGSRIIALQREGKFEEANDVMVNEVDSVIYQSTSIMNDIIKLKDDQMAKISAGIDQYILEAKQISVIVLAVSVLLALLISFMLSRGITKPLKEVTGVAQAVAEGNLTKKITKVRRDEIGELANVFNQMTLDLQKLIKEVIDASHQMASTSEELASSSQQNAAVAEQVSQTVSNVAVGTAQQSGIVNETVAAVTQLSTGIKHVAQNAEVVNISSKKVQEAVTNGKDRALLATEKIQEIHTSTEVVGTTIDELTKDSSQIGQIVDVISNIAQQTNLLALNAAIEAARAGEYGRGFAVVSDEVRQLAEQSRTSTESIVTLIKGIQENTLKAGEAMNTGAKAVEEGVRAVQNTMESFNLIAREIEVVTDQVEQVSAASQEMASSSDQMVESVQGIASISVSMDADTQEVAASVEEQTASMEEISSQAANLALLAEQLLKAVAKFQI